MRMKINHVTEYHYDQPVQFSLQRLRLTPRGHVGQTVMGWKISVDGATSEVEYDDLGRVIVHARPDDPRALGFVSAGEKRQGGVTEIGYMLAQAAQGQGIAREAVSGVITQLFAEGQHRVFADTDPDNSGSIALLEKLGFQLEGRLRHEWQTHIGLRDALIYGLLAEEWNTLTQTAEQAGQPE